MCAITKKEVGPNKIPYVVTHDARTIRFPHPEVGVYDSVKLELETGKIVDFCKFETGKPKSSCVKAIWLCSLEETISEEWVLSQAGADIWLASILHI